MTIRTATTAQTPEALLSDLRNLVSDADMMLGGATGADLAVVTATFRALYHAAHERFFNLCTRTNKKISAGVRRTDHAIRANPYQSLAIALGTGLLVGLLVGRRHN